MPDSNLFALLDAAAQKWPSTTGVIRGSQRLTFHQLKHAAEQLASQLRSLGIRAGDKIGLLCPNGPDYVIGSFALFAIDAVVVPIFPGLKEAEVATLNSELGLNAVCCSAGLEGSLPSALRADKGSCAIEGLPSAMTIARPHERTLPHDGEKPSLPSPSPLIRFTSGTTSSSKGVIIPQASMLEYTHRFVHAYDIRQGDGILDLLSMAHIFYQVTAAFLSGAKLVVEDTARTATIGEIIRREGITHIEAAPSFYTACLAETDLLSKDLRQVRYITSCGAPLPDKVAGNFRGRFGREIVQRYGLTETGPVLINTNEDPSKRGSLGTVAPGCEICLQPIDDIEDAGEIRVRCAGLFSGYFAPWIPQTEILDDGWFCTGDLARKDAQGFYWMTGRTKAMINVGAIKIFPAEIEALLLSHEDVAEARVFPAHDSRFGEVPHAEVILRPGSSQTEKDLLRYVNGTLSVFKRVRRIEIVDQISKTLTGKIKRHDSAQME